MMGASFVAKLVASLRRLGLVDVEVVRHAADILEVQSQASDELKATAAGVLGDADSGAKQRAAELLRALVKFRAPTFMQKLRGESIQTAPLVVESAARGLLKLDAEAGRRELESELGASKGDHAAAIRRVLR
jgi:hypothetical protein